jgi:acylphosphatase
MTVETLEIRVRGRVQGVGFRPNVFRLARELGLAGDVLNDAEGVLIRASGTASAMASFVERVSAEAPVLARVETVQTRALVAALEGEFRIVESEGGGRPDGGRSRRSALRRVRAGDLLIARASFSLPVHDLHALRAAVDHRARHPLRPHRDDHGDLPALPGVSG